MFEIKKRRKELIALRMTKEERSAVELAAHEIGLSLQDYIRATLARELERTAVYKVEPE